MALSPNPMAPLRCVGVDIYVLSNGIPQVPEKFESFEMQSISERGFKVAPGPLPESILTNWFCCRYLTKTDVSDETISRLLQKINSTCVWEKIQKLFQTAEGADLFTKAYQP